MKTLTLTLLTTALAAPCLAAPEPQRITIPVAFAKTFQVTETLWQNYIKDGFGSLALSGTTVYAVARPDNVTIKFRATHIDTHGTRYLMISDNKTLAYWDGRQFQKRDVARSEWPFPLMGLLNLPGAVRAVPVMLNGKPCLLLSVPIAGQSIRKLWLDAKTHLPVHDSMTMIWKGKSYEVTRTDYSGWVLNAPLPPSTFQFTPPAGAKEVPK